MISKFIWVKKMKRFKTLTGLNNVYELTKHNFSLVTKDHFPYVIESEDGVKRRYAVCPACDNPVQIIGYIDETVQSETGSQNVIRNMRLYGKHIKMNMPVARYNERAYRFCPYASKSPRVNKTSKKDGITAYEINLCNALKNCYDLAIYVLQQDTGIYISQKNAENLIKSYMDHEGYMYYWATLYNLPWMLLYFADPMPCFGMRVRRESPLWKYLHWRKDVSLTESHRQEYDIVGSRKKFLNLYMELQNHKRTIEDDEVKETVQMVLYSTQKDGSRKTEHIVPLKINEVRFPHLLGSAKYRNKKLLEMVDDYIM